ncbi:unnamed protein product [Caenorhabditis sp. 36 PRJEB53466]|nr:unnamed protein product [Caenorhabditis sp. 36 PRJEB53466]
MSIQSLHQLASKKMDEYIVDESLDVSSIVFPRKESNAIFEHIIKMKKPERSLNEDLLEQMTGFNTSRANFKGVEMTLTDVAFIGEQDLESFTLGDTILLMDGYHVENDDTILNIDLLTRDMFNDSTRQSLRHLDISGWGNFNGDWLRAIGSMLPNLVSLNVAGRPVNIQTLVESFPGLQYLNVSNCQLDSLDGISGLQGLRVLIMENAYKIRDMTELFELRELRVLNMACPSQFNADGSNDIAAIFCQFLEDGSRLPELRYLDLSKTTLNARDVKRVLKFIPTIQNLTLIGTNIALRDCVGHNTHTLVSTTKALEHYFSEDSALMIETVLQESCVLTDDFHIDAASGSISFEHMLQFVDLLHKILLRYGDENVIHGKVVENVWAITPAIFGRVMAESDRDRMSFKIVVLMNRLLDVYGAYNRSILNCTRLATSFLFSAIRDQIIMSTPGVNVQKLVLLTFEYVERQKNDSEVVGLFFQILTEVEVADTVKTIVCGFDEEQRINAQLLLLSLMEVMMANLTTCFGNGQGEAFDNCAIVHSRWSIPIFLTQDHNEFYQSDILAILRFATTDRMDDDFWSAEKRGAATERAFLAATILSKLRQHPERFPGNSGFQVTRLLLIFYADFPANHVD